MFGGHPTWREAIVENKKIFDQESLSKGKSKRFTSKSLIYAIKPYHSSKFFGFDDAEIKVINEDCCLVTKSLVDEGYNPLMLNMANRFMFAAGDLSSNTQEENIAGRSNLSFLIDDKVYPLELGDGVYTDKVTFIRDAKGKLLEKKDRYSCSVISMGFMMGP